MKNVAAAVLLLTAGVALTPGQLRPPAGPFGIGRIACDWTDATRPAWDSTDPQAHRELMVYLWYPTAKPAQDVRQPYFPGASQLDASPETQLPLRDLFRANWPLIVSGAIFSHAVERAPAAKTHGRFPLVIFSHGAGGSGFEYTSLIEDLVSRGYVVAAIEHTGLGSVVLFPKGRTFVPHEFSPPSGLSSAEKARFRGHRIGLAIAEGAADERFVLDRLSALNKGNARRFSLAGKLDLNRVATMGHSAGAEYAARAGQLDGRFKACVDLDGGMPPIAALPDFSDGATMKQPLLFLEGYHPESTTGGTHAQIMDFLKKKEEQLQTCPRGSYAVELKSPGMVHGSFSDHPLLSAAGRGADVEVALHNLDMIEAFIRAFLDRNLMQTQSTLFDGARATFPEATVKPYGN
jgi:dienelactone hydrolase